MSLTKSAKRYLKKIGKGVKEVGNVAKYYLGGGEYGTKQHKRLADAAIRQIKEEKRLYGKTDIPDWYRKIYKMKKK